MKTQAILGILLSTLGATSAFAIESAEEAAFYASKNYDGLVNNDDGRVTIIGPKFGSADGTTLWISSGSNLNGVCALFGYGATVSAALTTDGDFPRTVVIDANARFSSFGSQGYYNNSRVATIMCETGLTVGPSTRLEKPVIVNDDGTVTLMGPSFGSADGVIHYTSSASDLNGVCKQYGFRSAIAASLITEGDYLRTVVIGSDSRFKSFSSQGYYNNARIKSMMCNP